MNPNNRSSRKQAGGTYGETLDGYFTHRGGYTRFRPRVLHTPVPKMWMPRQPFYGPRADYGDALNNPIPMLDHHVAARSTGRVLRLPQTGDVEGIWAGGMIQDAAVMYVTPDPTLTAGATAAARFPENLSNAGSAAPQAGGWRLMGQFI